MKLYAPKYYKDFKCIANRCTHSCCVGWEIDIDEYTMEKYSRLNHSYRRAILGSIDTSDFPHFKLGEGERCPHLNSKGLCEIIIQVGQDHLCEICREHPRFYNDTVRGQEVGIGMACEEACRIILSSDDFDSFIPVGNTDSSFPDTEFDAIGEREKIFKILSDIKLTHKEKLCMIYDEYNVSPNELSDEEWQKVIASLEYLNEDHKKLFSCYSSKISETEKYEDILKRALAYFIYRHCSDTFDDTFYSYLGFSLFCERLLSSLLNSQNPKSLSEAYELARIVSEEIEYSTENTCDIQSVF